MCPHVIGKLCLTKILIIMKKILFILAAVLVAVAPVSAQSKAALKSAKKSAKVAQAEGYTLLESGDMVYRMAQHLQKVYDGYEEITATAEGKRSTNLAKSIARNNALNEYAEKARSIVKGRVASDMSDLNDVQKENFVAAYERLVLSELKGEVKTSYTLVRENKKTNTYDVKLVCLIDAEGAHKAHLNALNRAAEEQKLAQQYGSNISNWIQEGFLNNVTAQ